MADNKEWAVLTGIQKVMDEIGAIGKNKRNQTQGFNFRGIDDVMNTLHPLLAKAHIFVYPETLEISREERTNSKGNLLLYTLAKVRYHFVSTDDASEVDVVVYGEGMDPGDKSLNKAMSIAMKYACFQIFCIPTEEMVDPDAEIHQVAPKTEYPPEFLSACKLRSSGSTLGKIYKENRPLFENLKLTGTDEEKTAIVIIEKYMEGRK